MHENAPRRGTRSPLRRSLAERASDLPGVALARRVIGTSSGAARPSPPRGRDLAMLVSGLLALAASVVPSATTVAARVPRTVFFEKFGYLE